VDRVPRSRYASNSRSSFPGRPHSRIGPRSSTTCAPLTQTPCTPRTLAALRSLDFLAAAAPPPDYPLTLQTGLRERTYHHSRFRDHAWARKSSPDPWLRIHPETARRLGVAEGDWVRVETAGHPGRCRLRAKLTDATAPDTVATGMGWWQPDAPGPDFGALEVNINAAMSYAGPYDPMSGSADTRGLRCRVSRDAGG
jgi:thiosulfate reductase/polysulfide reductase chain A